MSKIEEIKAAVIRAVAELPDRNSPEGQPEMMLVSSSELLMILDEALAQPAGEAEPAAIFHGRCIIDCGDHGHNDIEMRKLIPAGSKLYTTPQQSQPLTDEQIQDMLKIGNPTEEQCELIRLGWNEAHGIKKGGTE